MNLTISKSDTLGIMAGILCMLHCVATPLLFIAVAGTASSGDESPFWWVTINYIFLIISLIAVHRSVRTTSRAYMKPLFWASWVALAFVVLNEQFIWLELSEIISYVTAIILVALHLYNRRYCRCEGDTCCAENS